MNPMLTRFPESVRIDGVRYPLNTDSGCASARSSLP